MEMASVIAETELVLSTRFDSGPPAAGNHWTTSTGPAVRVGVRDREHPRRGNDNRERRGTGTAPTVLQADRDVDRVVAD